MTRSSRTITEAGLYHVVARGNNRQVLFHEPSDYESYAALILKMKGDYDFELYHYCLMSNHVHLLFHCGEAGILSKIMQRINLAYAKKFRKKRRYVGHVFQDRFKSFPIERDSYLLECGRYIERNPLRAGIVHSPADYPWSSARFYLKGLDHPLVTRNPLYEELGVDERERQEKYRDYLLTERPYEQMIDTTFLKNQRV